MGHGQIGQIRWRNANRVPVKLPSFCKAGRRQSAECRVQAGPRQSAVAVAVAVALAAHGQPGILEMTWKEAAARLFPRRPFAEAAEEVGHTGRSLQGLLVGLAGWGKSTSVGQACRRACLAGDNFRMGAQQNALLPCYNNHSLLPKCGWQSRTSQASPPLLLIHFSPPRLLASSTLVHLASGFGRPQGGFRGPDTCAL